jgi:hypothetical protein
MRKQSFLIITGIALLKPEAMRLMCNFVCVSIKRYAESGKESNSTPQEYEQ